MNNAITTRDIKTAIRFAKVYAWIHAPLIKKPVTPEVTQRRAIRAAKLWASMFAYRLAT